MRFVNEYKYILPTVATVGTDRKALLGRIGQDSTGGHRKGSWDFGLGSNSLIALVGTVAVAPPFSLHAVVTAAPMSTVNWPRKRRKSSRKYGTAGIRRTRGTIADEFGV